MMEEIISIFDEADRLNDCKKKKIQEEAEEMLNMSLETFKVKREAKMASQNQKRRKEQVEQTL